MDPVTAILGAAAALGGILGGQRKHIDPEFLRRHFGPAAVSKEALELFNSILNSPMGQKIMTNAAEQGQQFARGVNRSAAQAGLAGPGGSSGTGIFATNAAEGATNSFQRDAAGSFYQMALPAAQEMVNNRMSAYLNDLYQGGYATNAQNTWANIGNAAGTIGAMLPQKSPMQVANTGMTGALAPQMPNPIPGGDDRFRTALGQTQPTLDPFSKSRLFTSMTGAVRPAGSQLGRLAFLRDRN